MSATIKPGVEFTSDGAVHTVGNGNVFHYKKHGNVFYNQNTPPEVVRILNEAIASRRHLRLHYGETDPSKPDVGRDWNDEYDVTGYIGVSCGPLRVPLMIPNERSIGGPAILDHCIVKIREPKVNGRVLYQHPKYKEPKFTVREIGPDEHCGSENLRAKGYTHAVDIDGSNNANFKSLKQAVKYVEKMTGRRV